jgi:(p)ppGpp synthase/HD superfamily hydrolase
MREPHALDLHFPLLSAGRKTVDFGMSQLENAIRIAVAAHQGQVDRAGEPYILHPLRVMARCRTRDEKTVAILHDVVEDTKWTFDDLRKEGFSESIIVALDCVTKREGEAYEDFIRRNAGNRLASRVKLADLEDNMDLLRNEQVTPEDLPRLNKYILAHRFLTACLEMSGHSCCS